MRSHTTSTSLALCASLCALLPPAAAVAQPRIVELQLSAEKFTQLIWDRLYTEEICVLDAFPFPPTGGTAVLDRVTFPERPQVVLEEGQASVLVRADVFLRSDQCLARDCAPNEYVGLTGASGGAVSLELQYDLALELAGTSLTTAAASICLSLTATRDVATGADVPTSLLPQPVVDLLSDLPCQQLPLEGLAEMVPATSTFTNSGMSAVPDGSRLAARLELDGPRGGSAASWAEFGAGVLAPIDPLMEWSLFVERHILEDSARTRLDRRLTCEEDPRTTGCLMDGDEDGVLCEDGDTDDAGCDPDPSFVRTSGPAASWSAGGAAGGGHLYVELAGEVPGGFSAMPCLNSVGVDPVEVDVDFRVEATAANWIRRHTVIDPDVVDSDVLVCALLNSIAAGPLALQVGQIVAAIAADLFDPDRQQLGLPGDCDMNDPACEEFCHQVDDDEYECGDRFETDPIDMDGPTLGVLTLNRMVGVQEGALLGGTFDRVVRPVALSSPLPPNPHVARQPLRLDNGLISFGVQGGCSSLRLGYAGSFRARGDGAMCRPVQICDDPPDGLIGCEGPDTGSTNIYALAWPEGEPTGSTHVGGQVVNVVFPAPPSGADALEAFFNLSYPLKVLMRTSAGLQHYTMAPPEVASVGEAMSAWLDAFSQCAGRRWSRQLPQKVLDGLWLIDPPPWEIDLQAVFADQRVRPDRESAVLRSLSVAVTAPADLEKGPGARSLEFPETMLLFEGEIEIDLGRQGRFRVPFAQQRIQTLRMTDVKGDSEVETTLTRDLHFSIESPRLLLPEGVARVVAEFRLPRSALRFRSNLIPRLER